jgi:hypothetical protein
MLDAYKCLFVRDGERFMPTPLARGPWTPDATHGGPPCALLGRAIERFDEAGVGSADSGAQARQTGFRPVGPMFVSRITLELLRPVPLVPLELRVRCVRPGRKVQLIEASLHTEQHEIARAVGLRIRKQEIELPDDLPMQPIVELPPEQGVPVKAPAAFHEGFHTHGVEHSFVRGQFATPGPATDWIRLRVPILEGESPSALERVCAAADFGNGVSQILTGDYTFINPDLTIYLHRYPIGEWVCLDSVTRVESHGVGVAESRLLDRSGAIGRSLQSLIVEERRR